MNKEKMEQVYTCTGLMHMGLAARGKKHRAPIKPRFWEKTLHESWDYTEDDGERQFNM